MLHALVEAHAARPPAWVPIRRAEAGKLFDWQWPSGLPDDVALSRTGSATQFDASGALVVYDADVPRLSNGWQIEGPSTNQVPNPRAEGATAGAIGSGGAWPTGWAGYGDTGLTVTIVAVGQDDGIDYIRVRLSGTTDSSTGFYAIAFLAAGELTGLSQNDPVSSAVFLRLVDDADIDDVTQIVIDHNEQNSGPSYLSTNTSSDFLGSLTSSFQRFKFENDTMDEATVDSVQAQVGVGLNTSAAVDITFDIGVPTTEEAAHVSSPILPAVSSPAASDRTAEVAEIDFGADVLSSVVSIECAWARSHADNANNPRIFELSDSASNGNNRTLGTINASSGRFQFRAFNANAAQATVSPATVLAADTRYAARCVVDFGNDALAVSLNGAAFETDSGGAFVQPRYMAIGQSVGAANHLNGTLRSLRVWNGDRWGALA